MRKIDPADRVKEFFRGATTEQAEAMLRWIDGFLAGRGVTQPDPPKRERKKRQPAQESIQP